MGVLLRSDFFHGGGGHACLRGAAWFTRALAGRRGAPGRGTGGSVPASETGLTMAAPESTSNAIRENIEAVRKMEEEFANKRTRSDRIADTIGGFTGTLT